MEGKASGRTLPSTGLQGSVLTIATLLVIAATTGIGVGVVGAQTSGPTSIDSCTTIDAPGEYVLTTNVTNTSADPCITITASDVVFDGGGHTLAGNKTHYGILVDNGDAPQSNVTVRNVVVDRWVRGIAFENATGGTVENTIATDSTEGYLVQKSTDVVVRNNYAHRNALGIHVRNAEENLVTDNLATDNKWGIHLEYRARNNRVVDNVARNNSEWDLIARQDSTANVVSRLDVGSGTFSFVGTNVALKGTDSISSAPSGQTGIDSSVEVTGATSEELSPTLDSLTVHYRNPSGSVSSLSIWRSDGGSWSELDSTTQPSENAVSTSNVTEFGTFAPFGASDVSAQRVTLDVTAPTLTQRSIATTTTTAGETTTATTVDTGTSTATTTQDATTESTTMAESAGSTTGAATTSDGTQSGGQATETAGPGFGLLAALVAVLAAALFVTRRDRDH